MFIAVVISVRIISVADFFGGNTSGAPASPCGDTAAGLY